MTTFTPPVETVQVNRLFKQNYGVTVIREGDTFRSKRNPRQTELDNATSYWLGGRSYEVTDEEATALTAAGYGDYLT